MASPEMLSSAFGGGHALAGPARDDRLLIFGPGRGIDEPFAALRRRRIDMLGEGLKGDPALHQIVEEQDRIDGRAKRPVDRPNDEDVARTDSTSRRLQTRPFLGCCRDPLILEEACAARRVQSIRLLLD